MKRAIRALLFVTKLSRVDAHKDKAAGWGATLKCASCPGCCGKKQEPPVQLSCDRKSELACLQELLKRLQDRHVDCAEALAKTAAADAVSAATVSPDPPNVLQAKMQLRQAKSRAEAANKLALEAEKERDAAEKAVEELKRQLQPKRPRTDDDAVDAHEMLVNVDNWDLRDHLARTASCITRVLFWLGGFHIGARGTLLWQSICFGHRRRRGRCVLDTSGC